MKRARLDRIEDRQALPVDRKPHWDRHRILKGVRLGLIKTGALEATWCILFRDAGKYRQRQLRYRPTDETQGVLVDVPCRAAWSKADANGTTILDYDQAAAQGRAQYEAIVAAKAQGKHIDGKPRRIKIYTAANKKDDHYVDEPVTVRDAVWRYLKLRESTKGHRDAQRTFDSLILPDLGDEPLDTLTPERLKEWRTRYFLSKPHARQTALQRMKGESNFHKVDTSDPDYERRRAATAQRVFAPLRAALREAHEGTDKQPSITENAAYLQVKPIKPEGARTVYKPECTPILGDDLRAVMAAAEIEGEHFANLAKVALYTGLRYGELCRLRVGDWKPRQGILYVAPGKTGMSRNVQPMPEGVELLDRICRGRKRDEVMLTKADGSVWGTSHQSRAWRNATDRAGIARFKFKSLRDTFGTVLLEAGVDLVAVSRQLGHASVTMTEKHYVQVREQFIRDEMARAGEFAVLSENVVDLESAKHEVRKRESRRSA